MLLSIALLICDFIDTTYYPKLSTIILNLFSTNMKRVHFLDFRPSESSTSGIMVSSITIQVGIDFDDFEDHFQMNGWKSTHLNGICPFPSYDNVALSPLLPKKLHYLLVCRVHPLGKARHGFEVSWFSRIWNSGMSGII